MTLRFFVVRSNTKATRHPAHRRPCIGRRASCDYAIAILSSQRGVYVCRHCNRPQDATNHCQTPAPVHV